jgi:hypothetical protein
MPCVKMLAKVAPDEKNLGSSLLRLRLAWFRTSD